MGKMRTRPWVIYRFNTISIKMPINFSMQTDKLILSLYKKEHLPRLKKTLLKELEGGFTICEDLTERFD